jgi:hypothetical protein
MPFDLKDDDDDNSPSLAVILPLHPTVVTSTAFTLPLTTQKEHTVGARIKAIYMLKDGQSASKIKAATRVSKSRVYTLAAVA